MLVALGGPAEATTLPAETQWERLQRAELVIEGDVVATQFAMAGPEDDRIPVTIHTVEVQRSLLGEPGDTVRVMIPGGPWGGDRYHMVVGTAQLRVGDHVLLTLGRNTRDTWRVIGWAGGAFVRSGDVALGGERAAVTSWDCWTTSAATIRLEPSMVDESAEPDSSAAEVRSALALPWSALTGSIEDCLASSPADGGAR